MRSVTTGAASAAAIALLMTALAPGSAHGDDASRISQLESDLRQLRIQLDDQLRRIQRLESELQAQSQRPRLGPMPGIRVDRPAALATGTLPWHSPQAWERVVPGMSVPETTAILGEPTSVESSGALKTLFYRGATPGSIPINGHINFRDDKVVAVNKPQFGD